MLKLINNLSNQKLIDSIENLGYDIYTEYDFYNFKGNKRTKSKLTYPVIAVKKENNLIKVFSIINTDSLVSREIVKKHNSLFIEKIINHRSFDEIDQSIFVITYKKDCITVFNFSEDVYSDKKKKFFLSSIYFVYKNKVEEYYQGNNSERMIEDLNKTDFNISKNDLHKVFTGTREIEKFTYYPNKNYNKIANNFIRSYLLLKN